MIRLLVPALLPAIVAACHTAPAPDDGLELRVQLVKLEHSTVAEVAPIVQDICANRMLACRGRENDRQPVAEQQVVLAHAATNQLVLLGTEAELHEMLELVARLDVPAEPVRRSSPAAR